VYGEDPGVGCRLYGAVTLWHLGFPEQASRLALAARKLADELVDPFNVARALYFSAFIHLCRREPSQVQTLAAALTELCREQGFALLVAGGTILHGWSRAEQGHTEEGIAQMREGLAGWHATGALAHRPYLMALLAEVLGRAGRTEEGLATLDEARSLSAATEERFTEAEMHRLRGELLRRQAPAEAEACFRQALAIARQQEARSLELRAALSLGRLLREQGREGQARQGLAGVYGWFTEGKDTPDLQEAGAFLEAGGAT